MRKQFRKLRYKWLKRRALKRARKNMPPLREFAYLDEVSLYSLSASQFGAIEAEFTDTQTRSLQDSVSVSSGLAIPPVKAGSQFASSSVEGTSTQVVRKAITQSAFGTLHEWLTQHMTLRPIPITESVPPFTTLSEVFAPGNRSSLSGWVVDEVTLTRGLVAELDIELETAPIMQVTTVFEAISAMFADSPEYLGGESGQTNEFSSVTKVLSRLMAGLIPIRGRAIDYHLVTHAGQRVLIHKRLWEQVTDGDAASVREVFVVAVVDGSQFWKDMRRVLFSKSTYRALVRITKDGLQETWNPITLAEVVGSLSRDLADQIKALELLAEQLPTALESSSGDTRTDPMSGENMLAYAERVAAHHRKQLDERLRTEVYGLTFDSVESFEDRRAAFKVVDDLISARLGIELDPVTTATYRQELTLDLAHSSTATVNHELEELVDVLRPYFIETEVVSIYW